HGGITDLTDKGLKAVFTAMSDTGMVLCIHAELPGAPILDREALYLKKVSQHIRRRFPQLRIVIEHLSTSAAVTYVRCCNDIKPGSMAGTITPQHLRHTIDDVL